MEVLGGGLQRHMQSYEVAHKLCQLHVEVVKKRHLLLVEGTEIVFVVEEEGSVAIGCLQGVPMLMTPVAMIADADVSHQTFASSRLLGRDGER